ncbi:MAG: type 1 glutamine amidotransferase [Gammaproteobacteria bacterium]|nr:MAG: type 1 glutamine amidotransferase [Gammaproteobacteria bacterium]
MHFHVLQHVSFEGPAAIEDWIYNGNHTLTTTKFFQADPLPALDDFDFLVVMGGPMGVEDVQQYPWLVEERRFIQQSIVAGKYILGICLGAQLIARALGARVKKNQYREIGWFSITIDENNLSNVLKDIFPQNMNVFHWHGDTFEIPDGARHFAASEACENQGFILDNRVIGLQFHIETTRDSTALLVQNCSDELDGSTYVQSEAEILADSTKFSEVNHILFRMMEHLTKQA